MDAKALKAAIDRAKDKSERQAAALEATKAELQLFERELVSLARKT